MHIYTSDGDGTEYGTKRLSLKTGSFCYVMLKGDPYQDVRTCNEQLTQWVFFIIYCKLQNICRVNFVVASLSKPAGYDKTYTNCVFIFHNNYPLRPIVKALYVYNIIPVSFTSSNIIHWHCTKCTDKYM